MTLTKDELLKDVKPTEEKVVAFPKEDPVQVAIKDINEALDEAENDDTPYPVLVDGKVNVVGDANKTEIKKHNFTVSFRFPKGVIPADGADASGEDWDLKRVEFKDIYITPRRDLTVMNAVVNVLPYFRKILENGGVEKMTEGELLMMGATMGNQAIDAMYLLVMRVLDIDEDLGEYITAMSAMRNTMEILRAFPHLANEADAFFE